MADPKEAQRLAHAEATTEASEAGETRQLYLRDGRTLTVTGQASEELVEIRSSAGMVEVRIRMTEQGPVLQMEAVRMQLKAAEAVDIETRQLNVRTEEGVNVAAKGDIKLAGESDVLVDAAGEGRINGKMIYLN